MNTLAASATAFRERPRLQWPELGWDVAVPTHGSFRHVAVVPACTGTRPRG